MKYQAKPYYCGPASLQNACRVLRVPAPSQDRLAALAATTEELGTDEEGLKRAILDVGLGYDEIAAADATNAYNRLWYSLMMGRPVLLCVDRWQHWVTAVGILGKHVLVWDPQRAHPNGLKAVDRGRFMRRWHAGRKTARKLSPYYGIAVGVA